MRWQTAAVRAKAMSTRSVCRTQLRSVSPSLEQPIMAAIDAIAARREACSLWWSRAGADVTE